MPKSKPAIPDGMLLTELDRLAGSLLITPEQVGLILSRTPKQLSDDRAAGNPPPFVKVNGSLRYAIGDLRDFIKRNTFRNTGAASKAREDRISGAAPDDGRGSRPRGRKNHISQIAHSFTAFANEGRHDDQWPFMIEAGKPIELFYSLTLSLTDEAAGEWLTLEKYLDARRNFALAQPKLEENAALTAELKKFEPKRIPASRKNRRSV